MPRKVSTVNIISGRNTIRQINNKSLIHFEDTRQIFVEKKKKSRENEDEWTGTEEIRKPEFLAVNVAH